MLVIARARERPYQQNFAFAGPIFHCGDTALVEMADGRTLGRHVVLTKEPPVDLAATHLKLQIFGKIGVELHIGLTAAEKTAKSIIGLRLSDMAMTAEI